MDAVWFSADHHFYHKNIIRYCNRPFKDINEMGRKLIKNHNELVKENDICYFIGDFAFLGKSHVNKVESILNKLNGRKVLILGNHDEGNPFTYVNLGFESVHTSLILPEDNDFILCHDPACSIVDKNRKWIVGHVHDLFFTQGNCINVGVDIHNYKPVSLDFIKSIDK